MSEPMKRANFFFLSSTLCKYFYKTVYYVSAMVSFICQQWVCDIYTYNVRTAYELTLMKNLFQVVCRRTWCCTWYVRLRVICTYNAVFLNASYANRMMGNKMDSKTFMVFCFSYDTYCFYLYGSLEWNIWKEWRISRAVCD